MPDPPEIPPDSEAGPEQPSGQPQYVTIGPAVEHDTAMPLNISKHVTIGTAVEHDTAMPLQAHLVPTVVYAVGAADGWHLTADHHDLVAYGTELLVVIAFIFVGAKLVARRLFRPSADD
jgi:hypothetical protein